MPKEVPKEDPKIPIISDGHADNTRVVFDGKILPAVKSILLPGEPARHSLKWDRLYRALSPRSAHRSLRT